MDYIHLHLPYKSKPSVPAPSNRGAKWFRKKGVNSPSQKGF